MSRRRRPRNADEALAWLKQLARNLRDVQEGPGEVPLNPDLATWFADAVGAYQKPTRRSMEVALGLNEAEARERLKQLANNLRDIQKEQIEALPLVAETARRAEPQWIAPTIPLRSDLAIWFVDAVDAYTLEKPTRRKPRARSMDVALGLKRPAGRPRGTDMGGRGTAIEVYDRRRRKETFGEISEHLEVDVRSLQRASARHADGIIEHLSGGYLVPLGYDAKDGKLTINESEAATVRMIFERFAGTGPITELNLRAKSPPKLPSVTTLVSELKAEGITGKRGKPIDKRYLYRLLNNPIYVGEAVGGMYPDKYKAIVSRVLWNKVRKILSGVTPRRAAKPDN